MRGRGTMVLEHSNQLQPKVVLCVKRETALLHIRLHGRGPATQQLTWRVVVDLVSGS